MNANNRRLSKSFAESLPVIPGVTVPKTAALKTSVPEGGRKTKSTDERSNAGKAYKIVPFISNASSNYSLLITAGCF